MTEAILVFLIIFLCTLLFQYHRRLQEIHKRYRALLDISPDAIVVHSGLRVLYANQQAVRLLEAKSETDLIGRSIFEFYDEHDVQLVEQRMKEIFHTKQYLPRIEQRLKSLTGRPLDVDIAASYIPFRGKPAIQVVIRDITVQKQSENELLASEENYLRLLDLLPDAIVVHSEGKIVFCNEKAADLMGLPHPSDLIGSSGLEFVQEEFRSQAETGIQKLYSQKGSLSLAQSKIIRNDGKVIDIETSANWIRYHGKPSILMILRDITLRKREETQLKASKEKYKILSHLDGLTGIKNRRYFDEVFVEYWQRSYKQGTSLALILFDIDHFKAFNDSYGHQDGDECLRQVAAAVESVLSRPEEFVARYGGEEFAIVLPETSIEEAIELAHRIRKTVEDLRIPHPHSTVSNHVTLSVGVSAAVPNRHLSPGGLIYSADKALYEAKLNGRNLVAVHTL